MKTNDMCEIKKTKRTKIFNVIILDKSGSMSSIRRAAIDGVNETIASIKRGQEQNPEQDNMLTLVAFCGCEIKKIYDNTPIAHVKPIKPRHYQPCCMTPLYDAMGSTITEIHRQMEGGGNAIASVTVITDGYENASREYSHVAIKSLIEAYKSEGWLFAYIGADHDVESVAYSLAIDNHLEFDKSRAGMKRMASNFMACRMNYVDDCMDVLSSDELDDNEKTTFLKERSKNFFN
ncbi:MAG: VWA domain-containing protein [Muribaculaceae bacterium]|nr:VWA domain-containing protein [Muribaculaceae bacterium]